MAPEHSHWITDLLSDPSQSITCHRPLFGQRTVSELYSNTNLSFYIVA